MEKKYSFAKKWSLVTVLEEEKDCYLYEKLDYTQLEILEEINPQMYFVLYVKENNSPNLRARMDVESVVNTTN